MRSLAWILLVVSVVVVPTSARADGDAIVLESYTGDRPAEASTLLEPLLSELAARKFTAGGVSRTYEATVSRPVLAPDGLPATFGERVEKGRRAWISGKFDEAVEVLGPAIDAAHANPGAVIATPAVRAKVSEALIALALSQHRLGDPNAAKQTFTELLRSFPDAQVAKGTYGPDAANLFAQVRKELAAITKGRLLVKLMNEDAEVFVNERLDRKGTTVLDLLPGTYRVIVREGSTLSRAHIVNVEAGKERTLTVDLAFDATVRTTPTWAGFVFAKAADRDRLEATYAKAFTDAVNARAVIVVGIDEEKGRPAIVGSQVMVVNSRVVRKASVALDTGAAGDRLRSLAKFLAGDEASADIDVDIAGDAKLVQAVQMVQTGQLDRPREEPRWGGWTWIAGVGAVGALAAGGALLYLDGNCKDGSDDPNCPDVYDNAAPGWVSVGAGAVLVGITAYLIVTRPDDKEERASAAFVVPTDGGAVAGYTTRF